jgi:hypothetical protein
MNKALTIEKMHAIKKNHIAQTDKVFNAIQGRKVYQPTALSHKECEFGEWLYSEDNGLEVLFGSIFFEKLERIHEQWHQEYAKLFKILFEKQNKGFLSKMMSPKIDPREIDKAKLYYSNLEETTSELLKTFQLCEKRILALNEERFI